MRIKSFTGPTVKEALRLVKAEFGEHALIMSNKKLPAGQYEVVAAIDYNLAETATAGLKAASKSQGRILTAGTRASLESELKKELSELRELKELCFSFAARSGTPAADVFNRLEENLVKGGVDRRLAKKILMNTLSGVTRDKAADIIYLKSRMRKKVYEKIAVKDPLASNGALAFVGSEGVGKTTTIAKLAALHAVKGKKRMALLTMDTSRIAGADQLKAYGRLMGVPVEVARDIRELKSAMASHRDKELLLVDTAGLNHRDPRRMSGLMDLADACPSMKFNLVLNSQTRDEAMYESVKGFGALPIDSLSFTRLDEGAEHGAILNAMVMARKPAAYLSTGSRVPEDIETASKERLLGFCMPN